MRIIEPRIQNSDNDTVALIFRFRAVKNTRFVDVDFIGHDFCFRRSIGLPYDQIRLGIQKFADLFKIFGLNGNFKAA